MVERRLAIVCAAAFFLAGMSLPLNAQTFQLSQGQGVPVCEAYKKHLESYAQLARLLACGERFFDVSTSGISASQWQPLDLKKHLALYEKLQTYESTNRAKQYSWSKKDIERNIGAALKAAKSGDASMSLSVLDLNLDGTVEHVVMVQQGACLRAGELRTEELRAARTMGIDLTSRMRNRRPGGLVYLVNGKLADIDRRTHERYFGVGGAPIEFFLFERRAYKDAFDAAHKANFFGPGTFTVMDASELGSPSVCQVGYQRR